MPRDKYQKVLPDVNMSKRNEIDEARRKREMFRKRKSGLVKKANEMAQKCDVDVYLLIYRYQQGKYYTYTSTERSGWPPDERTIVCIVHRSLVPILMRSVGITFS